MIYVIGEKIFNIHPFINTRYQVVLLAVGTDVRTYVEEIRWSFIFLQPYWSAREEDFCGKQYRTVRTLVCLRAKLVIKFVILTCCGDIGESEHGVFNMFI